MHSVFVSLFLLAGSALAAPYQRRGMAQVVNQCIHDFSYTWDDGPYVWHQEIIDTFDSVGGKTTFYVNGDNWSCIYDQDNVDNLRATYRAGHQIASHTWSHRALTTLSESEIDYEIQRLDEAFIKIIGVKPKFLRPPYGDIDERTSSYIQSRHNKIIVLWDADSGDSLEGTSDAQHSIDFYNGWAAERPHRPHLTLSHEVQEPSIVAMRAGTVRNLHNSGINLVTTAQCLDKDPYFSDYYGGFRQRDNSWFCGNGWSYTPINPQNPPTTTSTSTTSASQAPSCVATYISVANDNCATIGTKFGLSSNAILTANSFLNCNDVWVGTHICIPPGGSSTPITPTTTTTTTTTSSSANTQPSCVSRYTSVANDNCATIGAKYGLSSNAILTANSFLNCNDVWVGTSICIPPGGTPPTSTTSTSSTPPPGPSCVSRYISVAQDNCVSIGSKFGLSGTAISNANTFVNCNDIWVGTNLCIPPGGTPPSSTSTSSTPPQPSCVQTYSSLANDSCTSIGAKFGLSANAISTANSFVNCNDIWTGTPICIPPGGSSPPPTCSFVYISKANDNCASIGAMYGVSGDTIHSWNTYLNCNDIWAGSPIAIKQC